MKTIILLFTLLVLPQFSHAQYFSGPASSAMGGAGRASIDPIEGGQLSPASLAHINKYHLGVLFSDESTNPAARTDGNAQLWGVVAADGTKDKMFPASVSYTYKQMADDSLFPRIEQSVNLAMAEFIGRGLAFGVGVNYLRQNIEGGSNYSQTNGGVSVLYTPTDWLGLALVTYNLVPASDSIPRELRLAPAIAFGTHLIYGDLVRFRFDVLRQEKFNAKREIEVMSGFESILFEFVALRLGTTSNYRLNKQYFTAGLGWVGPKLRLDYAFVRDTDTARNDRHLIDIWMGF